MKAQPAPTQLATVESQPVRPHFSFSQEVCGANPDGSRHWFEVELERHPQAGARDSFVLSLRRMPYAAVMSSDDTDEHLEFVDLYRETVCALHAALGILLAAHDAEG